MKKHISAILLCGLLTTSFASCTQDETSSSSSEETSVVTTEAVTEAETTDTEPITEEVAQPEYYSSLVYPDSMTDKEKANTAYRDFTLIYFDKAREIGNYNFTYSLDTSDYEYISEIQDNIRELKIYDEQLDTNFLMHITLPPDYDESREYPIFFITDSQYWFKCVPDMWKLMKNDEAEPVIIATLGCDYDTDGYSDVSRWGRFGIQQDKMLDFITNDAMGLISANYKTDPSRSVFFGHSLGGLFAHYALCNSDKYEYQPFANYIIGSPALWAYYYEGPDGYDFSSLADNLAYRDDFGYFDRHETMDKKVFICAGEREKYEFEAPELPTITQDAQTLYDRLSAHSAVAEIMIYDKKHHMDYVEDMLTDYLKKNFPPEGSSANAENLVFPDTMTDKEKAGTYYRGDTILDADKAYEIGEYHLPLNPTQRSRVKKMIGNVREMRIYDEQLDLNFMANIVLPPDYDENKEYPVVLITDSQYWIDEVANLWKLIGDGETSPVIFATLRLDYEVNGYDDEVRYGIFAEQQDKMLDFITDDFMKLISLNYKTDASRSVFFGHSLGGLFSHYALCNSDKYEYQPFANYIIASPAMWSYYYTGEENFDTSGNPDPYAYRNDFGYFDRNESMDKDVFICAGAEEHYNFDAPDLATIPQDAQTIYERFTSHGVNAEIKLYEGMMHMSYVEDMLKEYMKQHFPPQ